MEIFHLLCADYLYLIFKFLSLNIGWKEIDVNLLSDHFRCPLMKWGTLVEGLISFGEKSDSSRQVLIPNSVDLLKEESRETFKTPNDKIEKTFVNRESGIKFPMGF